MFKELLLSTANLLAKPSEFSEPRESSELINKHHCKTLCLIF